MVTLKDATIKELTDAAIEQLVKLQEECGELSHPGPPRREFALAITALEDAQMRATRGLAKTQGVFAPADLQYGVE